MQNSMEDHDLLSLIEDLPMSDIFVESIKQRIAECEARESQSYR
jgi:hypothetical protein